MEFGRLGDPINEALGILAKRDGLKEELTILFPKGTAENVTLHEKFSRGRDTFARCCEGEIVIYPWMWNEMIHKEGMEAAIRSMANALAEEIFHAIDFGRFSKTEWAILDFPFLLIRKVRNSTMWVPRPIRNPIDKLYDYAYETSFFEKRAKRYALDHEEEYFQAIWPHIGLLIDAYVEWSKT